MIKCGHNIFVCKFQIKTMFIHSCLPDCFIIIHHNYSRPRSTRFCGVGDQFSVFCRGGNGARQKEKRGGGEGKTLTNSFPSPRLFPFFSLRQNMEKPVPQSLLLNPTKPFSEDMIDHRSYTLNLDSCEIKPGLACSDEG